MSYRCIGHITGPHGRITECQNTSDTPINPLRPDWGYLCPSCANRPPERRAKLQVELPEADPPNPSVETAGSSDGYVFHKEKVF